MPEAEGDSRTNQHQITSKCDSASRTRTLFVHPLRIPHQNQNNNTTVFFIPCDSVHNRDELTILLWAHLNIHLLASKDPTAQILAHLKNLAAERAVLLVLDNFETVWEPTETREEVEDFLSALSGISELAIILTMRGSERPAKVLWTRPFLPALSPLSNTAARQIFDDIVGESTCEEEEVDRILQLADNVPLAITLLAYLVDSDGCAVVLSRWESERTAMIADNYSGEATTKRSSLDLSISLSLSSPRLPPGALDLLSVLSLLPDGLSDPDLIQLKLPIAGILACKTALLRTSLAYIQAHGQRLVVLLPIREYTQIHRPADFNALARPLFGYYRELLRMHERHTGTGADLAVMTSVRRSFANIQSVLSAVLHHVAEADDTREELIRAILSLDRLSKVTGRGAIPLLARVPGLLPTPINPDLEVFYVADLLDSTQWQPVSDWRQLLERGERHVKDLKDSAIACKFHYVAAAIHRMRGNTSAAMDHITAGLELATQAHNKIYLLTEKAWTLCQIGRYTEGLSVSRESQLLAQLTGQLSLEAGALRVQVICLFELGDNSHSVALCTRGRKLLDLCGMSGSTNDRSLRSAQAQAHMMKTEYLEARGIYTEIMAEIISPEADRYRFAFTLLNICELDIPLGAEASFVQNNLGVCRTVFSELGYQVQLEFCDFLEGDLHRRQGELAEAEGIYHKCLALWWGSDAEMETYALDRLASLDLVQYEWPAGGTSPWSIVYLAHSTKHNKLGGKCKALQALAHHFLRQGESSTAANLFAVAREVFEQTGVRGNMEECMAQLLLEQQTTISTVPVASMM